MYFDKYHKKYNKYKNKYLLLKNQMNEQMIGGDPFCAPKPTDEISNPEHTILCETHGSNWKECLFSPETNGKCYYHSDFFSMDQILKDNRYSPIAWSSDELNNYIDYVYVNVKEIDKFPGYDLESFHAMFDILNNQNVINQIKILITRNHITGKKIIEIIKNIDQMIKSKSTTKDDKYDETIIMKISLFLPNLVIQSMDENIFNLKSVMLILFYKLWDVTYNIESYHQEIRLLNYSICWLKLMQSYFNNKTPNFCAISHASIRIGSYESNNDMNLNRSCDFNFNLEINQTNMKIIKYHIATNSNLIFIPITLNYKTTTLKHANMLLLNAYNSTVTRFEPHGSSEKLIRENNIDEYIKYLFRMIGVEITYLSPINECPRIISNNPTWGIQRFEVKETEKKSDRSTGLCVTFSYAFIIKTLTNPNKNLNEIQKELMGSVSDVAKLSNEYKELQNLIYDNLNDLMYNIIYACELHSYYDNTYGTIPELNTDEYDIIQTINDIADNKMEIIQYDIKFIAKLFDYYENNLSKISKIDDKSTTSFENIYVNIITYLKNQPFKWRHDVFYIYIIDYLSTLEGYDKNRYKKYEKIKDIIIKYKTNEFMSVLNRIIQEREKIFPKIQEYGKFLALKSYAH